MRVVQNTSAGWVNNSVVAKPWLAKS